MEGSFSHLLLYVAAIVLTGGCGDRNGREREPIEGRSTADRGSDAREADAAIRRAMADSGSWPSYGRDYTNRRFSPLRPGDRGARLHRPGFGVHSITRRR